MGRRQGPGVDEQTASRQPVAASATPRSSATSSRKISHGHSQVPLATVRTCTSSSPPTRLSLSPPSAPRYGAQQQRFRSTLPCQSRPTYKPPFLENPSLIPLPSHPPSSLAAELPGSVLLYVPLLLQSTPVSANQSHSGRSPSQFSVSPHFPKLASRRLSYILCSHEVRTLLRSPSRPPPGLRPGVASGECRQQTEFSSVLTHLRSIRQDFNNGVRTGQPQFPKAPTPPKAPAFPAKGGNNQNKGGNNAGKGNTATSAAPPAASSASANANSGDAQTSLSAHS